jgi:multicomponent Na+:H+ antiporter subunit F
MTVIGDVIMGVLAVALVLSLIRLARGPSLADRIVALDLMATITVAVAGVYAIAYDQTVFLDVAIVIALISFVGTVGIAVYMGSAAKEAER